MPKKREGMSQIPLWLSNEMIAEIDKVAKSLNSTRTGVIRAAVRRCLLQVKSNGIVEFENID
jgi:metal-responsive CopG/Arc/MetJ family transcriptional regulator